MKSIKKLLKDKSRPLVIPGVYDAIGAKIVEKVGFDAMFQTGYWTSATFDPPKKFLMLLRFLILVLISIH